jgi:hypothetical protein
MKIRRFNENQQYLTEPFDPEMSTELDVSNFINKIEEGFKIIAKKYNLEYNSDDRIHFEGDAEIADTTYEFIKGTKQISVLFRYIGYSTLQLDIHYEDTDQKARKDFSGFKTMEDVENLIKDYFKV